MFKTFWNWLLGKQNRPRPLWARKDIDDYLQEQQKNSKPFVPEPKE